MSNAEAESAAKEAIEKSFRLISARDMAILDEFALEGDVLLAGSEEGETAKGHAELRAFFTRLFARPSTYSYEIRNIDASQSGDIAWFFAEGEMTVERPEGKKTGPYCISGVLERIGDRWLWRQYHGAEPEGWE